MLRALVLLSLACAALLPGCARPPELVPPEVLVAPYRAGLDAEPLWAVAPLRNESGTTIADALKVSDAVIAKLAEVRGLTVLPLNRTIAAMRALRMPAIATPEDARRLADALGADTLVVGTVTAYDPYNPPKLGITLAIYGRSPTPTESVDPAALGSAARESASNLRTSNPDAPLSVAQVYLDGANHGVLMELKRYSEGRRDDSSALGWRRFLASMDDFTEFAAYSAVSKLMARERLRSVRATVAIKDEPR